MDAKKILMVLAVLLSLGGLASTASAYEGRGNGWGHGRVERNGQRFDRFERERRGRAYYAPTYQYSAPAQYYAPTYQAPAYYAPGHCR
jgi:hypothetical protein